MLARRLAFVLVSVDHKAAASGSAGNPSWGDASTGGKGTVATLRPRRRPPHDAAAAACVPRRKVAGYRVLCLSSPRSYCASTLGRSRVGPAAGGARGGGGAGAPGRADGGG